MKKSTKSIWLIMVGAILIITLVIIIIQGWVIAFLLGKNMFTATPQTPAVAQSPTTPTSPRMEVGTPIDIPTLSPDTVWQQLGPFDEQTRHFDEWVERTEPEKLEEDECRPYIGKASGECWMYSVDAGHVIFVREYTYVGRSFKVDVYAYDFDGDEQSEVLKWDLEMDGVFDVIEYDIDGNGVVDLALADLNGNGRFDENEIYMYQPAARRWEPLVAGALPFPVLPIFPY